MNILWMTWKDRDNPLAGGAEVVASHLGQRLVADGHTITFLTSGFVTRDGIPAPHREEKDGYSIVRVGSRFTVYWEAYKQYKKFNQTFDLVIDEINTIPFLAGFYAKEKVILFIHQLAREIWFYEIFFPLSLIGYLLEPIYLWLLRKHQVITVSESSKKDIVRFGFKPKNIDIITEGLEMEPLAKLPDMSDKYEDPTMLAIGSVRPMKRTLDVVKAFEFARETMSSLKLIIAGDMSLPYGQKVFNYVEHSPHRQSISCIGKIDFETKKEIMRKTHVLCIASLKEGWGLTVSEANSQGTPAVAYDVEGLRDSIKDNNDGIKTGLLSKDGNPKALAKEITSLLQDEERYTILRENAWKMSKELTFDNAYKDFKHIIERHI